MPDLTHQSSHFAFGQNWRSFAGLIEDVRIERSNEGIARLFAPGELAGKSVLDIGCGSGLPAVSLLLAGAAHVTCVDIDPISVEAARATLSRHAPVTAWSAETRSVFDLEGSFDVVYSWGVLHHTGDMWRAIDKAACLVRPGGLLCIAIYARTALCAFWRAEKSYYSKASAAQQRLIRALFRLWRLVLTGLATRRPFAPLAQYQVRGMELGHDEHDWLGGYPYESATPAQVVAFLADRGFALRRDFHVAGGRHGLLGSGCDEYVFVKGRGT